ncbi:uncharacterized protein LOC133785513 [Humulus lupulus]|uniref:uncharacterized protein LOC133785513 n=1 Tax=Humulus lupulus TaxID=3486 RepID=UPI002B4160CB|nr:uncharacterized protein LOC133785513 [Humulus lupulus]
MVRRKKTNQKPANRSRVNDSPLIQKACEEKVTDADEDVPEEMEEVFKDSMVEFPEVGDRGMRETDESLAGMMRNGFIKRIWGKLGIDRVDRLNAGYNLVKFRDEATRDLVLEAGVLHFDRKLVKVKPWTADLDTLKAVKSVPVWIRLPGLGLQYWGTKCLSALMSTIGNLILVDKVTKDRTMMQFARVLVEIEITEKVPKSIQFINEKGQPMEQLLEFEWLPTQCKECRVFGHTEMMCNRKQKEIWRQKSRNEEEETKQDPKKQRPLTKDKEITTGGCDIGQQQTDATEVKES